MSYDLKIDYSNFILQYFPDLPSEGFYIKGRFPATILGKVLMAYPQIKSPAEVLAFYYKKSFLSSFHLVITATMVHGKGIAVPLAEIKEATYQKQTLVLYVNKGGGTIPVNLKVKTEKDAKALARFFEAIARIPKTKPFTQEIEQLEQELNKHEIRWIRLKDQILQTLDTLHQMYQAGKISLVEYEETRQKLLERL